MGGRRGRTVCSLHFTSGCSVVYKPRSVRIDEAFNGLVDWLNGTGAAPALRPALLGAGVINSVILVGRQTDDLDLWLRARQAQVDG